MVSLTIMATMTGTQLAPAHFHTAKLQMTGLGPVRVLSDIIWFLGAQWRVGNGWNGGDGGWVGWGAGTQFYGVTKYN